MGWEVYDRPRIVPSHSYEAERMKLRGWLELAETLTPTDAWKAKNEIGLNNMGPDADDLAGQAYTMACREWEHRQEGPRPHPLLVWKLDQDRRCHDGHLAHAYAPPH